MLGVRNTYTWLNQDMLDSVSDPKWKTMLFALAFMHTIVQERRKFGPLGFNILYEFSQADLSACVTYMQNHLNMMAAKRRPVDWITVNYTVCDVQYGGKITDDWDRRLFNTYGKSWLVEKCLSPDFKFVPGNDTYFIPPFSQEIETYRKYIDSLPLVDDPEVFGLHGNADLAYRTAQAATTLGTIQDIQPKEGGGGGGLTREEIVLNMVEDLQKKLPPNYNGEVVKNGIKVPAIASTRSRSPQAGARRRQGRPCRRASTPTASRSTARALGQGANALTDSEPKVRFAPLPVLWISAPGARRKAGKELWYECPSNTCPARAPHGTELRNYISMAELRSEDPVNKWTLRKMSACSRLWTRG
jgi:hypothetical protein